MLSSKVKNRIIFLTTVALITLVAIFFVIQSLDKNILYFSSPTEIKQSEDVVTGKKMRIGGMVKKNSIKISENNIQFIVTDFNNEIIVNFSGTVPNLFAEEKGVVAEGKLKDKSFFEADRILAKHDENYMPPEIKKIMNNSYAK